MNLVSLHDKQDMGHSAIARLRRGAGSDWFSSDIADYTSIVGTWGKGLEASPIAHRIPRSDEKTRDEKTG